MSESWDDYADEWDTNPDVIKYSENAFNVLLEEFDINGLNILDYGCGTGQLTEKMAARAKNVIAIDNSAKMIEILKAKNIRNIDALAIDLGWDHIKSLPALRQKFNFITASSVFSFVDDYEGTLTLLKALLAPTGYLIQWDWLSEGGEHGFDHQRIEEAYSKAGYKTKKIQQAFTMTGDGGTMKVIMGIASPIF